MRNSAGATKTCIAESFSERSECEESEQVRLEVGCDPRDERVEIDSGERFAGQPREGRAERVARDAVVSGVITDEGGHGADKGVSRARKKTNGKGEGATGSSERPTEYES